DVLKRYKDNQLQCLVQVDKAGEGFNNKRSSVLVFLNLIRSSSKLAQQLGRGLRRNHALPFDQDVCFVFASADTEIATFLENLELSLGLAEVVKQRKSEDDEDDIIDNWPTIAKLAIIDALYERTENVDPSPGVMDDAELSILRRVAENRGAQPEQLEGDLTWLRSMVAPFVVPAATDT